MGACIILTDDDLVGDRLKPLQGVLGNQIYLKGIDDMKITNIETYRTKVLNNLKDVFILNWNGTYTESSFKPCYENIGKVRILFNVMEFINYHYDSDLNRVIDRTVLIDVDSEGQVGIWEVKPNEKFFTLVDYVSDYNDNQTVYQMEVVKRLCGILK